MLSLNMALVITNYVCFAFLFVQTVFFSDEEFIINLKLGIKIITESKLWSLVVCILFT